MQLPSSLRDICSVIGEQKTIELVNAIGGQRVWIPRKSSPNSFLFKILGYEAACKLSSLCGGSQIVIPLCVAMKKVDRDVQIRRDRASLSINELVAKYGISDRQIRAICNAKNTV